VLRLLWAFTASEKNDFGCHNGRLSSGSVFKKIFKFPSFDTRAVICPSYRKQSSSSVSMKSITSTLCVLALVGLSVPATAALVVPGTTGPGANSDGELSITADTVIDLSKATTGTWDQDNTANQGNGVYDPAKWAVVFKYSHVTIGANAKVTFKNHGTRAPVVWLVSGSVIINGTLDLSGQSARDVWTSSTVGFAYHPLHRPLGGVPTEPGPGGFRGGAAWRDGNVLNGPGFGPGGGPGASGTNDGRENGGLSAGFGIDASRWWAEIPAGVKYGNPSLVPLIGGSGGGGSTDGTWGWSGGAGGGAILIACTNNISFGTGRLISHGGNGDYNSNGAGSGGGIRLICANLVGSGELSARGGGGTVSVAGSGRIRLERVANDNTLNITPAPSVVDLLDGSTPIVWPPVGSPQAKVLSINTQAAPADPKASFGAATPDVALPLVSSADVIIETINVEEASTVMVRIAPRNGMVVNETGVNGVVRTVNKRQATEVKAAIKQIVSTNPLVIHWEATVPTLMGYSAVQARVIRP
jgi:hypothetical protein